MSEERYLKITMPKTGDAGRDPLAEFSRHGAPTVTVIDADGSEECRIAGVQGVHVVSDGGFMEVHLQVVAKVEFPEE